jgi:hypothetical protein
LMQGGAGSYGKGQRMKNTSESIKKTTKRGAWTQERYLKMRQTYKDLFPEMLGVVDLLAQERGLTVPVHDKAHNDASHQ